MWQQWSCRLGILFWSTSFSSLATNYRSTEVRELIWSVRWQINLWKSTWMKTVSFSRTLVNDHQGCGLHQWISPKMYWFSSEATLVNNEVTSRQIIHNPGEVSLGRKFTYPRKWFASHLTDFRAFKDTFWIGTRGTNIINSPLEIPNAISGKQKYSFKPNGINKSNQISVPMDPDVGEFADRTNKTDGENIFEEG